MLLFENDAPMAYTVAEIAKTIGGEVVGDPDVVIRRFAPADRAELMRGLMDMASASSVEGVEQRH